MRWPLRSSQRPSRWGLAIRRINEAAAANVVVMAVLFIPILLGMYYLYPWTNHDVVAASHLLENKTFYLNVPFGFCCMAVIALAYPAARVTKQVQVDWLGAALLFSGISTLLIAIGGDAGSTLLWIVASSDVAPRWKWLALVPVLTPVSAWVAKKRGAAITWGVLLVAYGIVRLVGG